VCVRACVRACVFACVREYNQEINSLVNRSKVLLSFLFPYLSKMVGCCADSKIDCKFVNLAHTCKSSFIKTKSKVFVLFLIEL